MNRVEWVGGLGGLSRAEFVTKFGLSSCFVL